MSNHAACNVQSNVSCKDCQPHGGTRDMPDAPAILTGSDAAPADEPSPVLAAFAAAFQHVTIGMAVSTPDARLVDVNPALSHMLGYVRDELLALGLEAILHPEDRDSDTTRWQHLEASEASAYQREKRYLRKDGSVLWGLVTVSALRDEHGIVVGSLAQVQDVTAQKAAEAAAREHAAQLEALVGQLPVALYSKDPDSCAQYQFVSPRFTQLAGLGRDDLPASFDALLARVHPDDREAVKEADEHAARTGEPARIEYRIRGGNGEWIWMDNRSVLMRDERGCPRTWHGALLDISEQKRLEVSLRDSEERFRRAFEDAAIGMSLGTPDDVCLDANPAYCRIVGRSREEVIGRPFAEFTHPDDVAAYARQHARLYANEVGSYQIEKRYSRPDGTVVTGLLTVSAVRDASGAHLYDIGQLQDVTAQKVAEAALRESEAHLRSIVEQLPAAVYRLAPGASGGFTYTSPRFATLTGLALDRRDGSLEDYLARVHPDDVATVREADAAAGRTGQPLDLEYRLRAQDDSWIWVQDRSLMTQDEQGDVAWHGMLLDISDEKRLEAALRESEARFRALVHNDPDVILIIDDTMSVVYMSPSVSAAIGISPEELLGPFALNLNLVHPDDLDQGLALFGEVGGRPGATASVEARIMHRDLGWRWFQVTIANQLQDPGIAGYLFNLRDITDRKLAELDSTAALQAQQSAIAELERLNQSKSRFLSTISHEFRTPLTAIIGYSELLVSSNADPALVAEDAAIIHREASRLNRMVDDVLLLDSADAGSMSLKMKTVDGNALVQDVVATFRPLTDGHQLSFDLDPTLLAVDGDRDQLSQALTNLVSNAVKYSPAGGAITIATRHDGENVVISVRDEGIGIATSDLSRIFDRFERVETGNAGRIAGTGLGLSIAQEIASLHGGRLWAESELGRGSAFYLVLPAAGGRAVEESRSRVIE